MLALFDDSRAAMNAKPCQLPPVFGVAVEEQCDARITLDVRDPRERTAPLRLLIDCDSENAPNMREADWYDVRLSTARNGAQVRDPTFVNQQ